MLDDAQKYTLSFLDDEKTLSHPQEYVEKIVPLLKDILSKSFPGNHIKQEIKINRDRINFACPICMDSTQSHHKKRGNIILSGKHQNYYKCFNCGKFTRVDRFFREYNVILDLNVIDYIISNQENFKVSNNAKYDASVLLDLDLIDKYALGREEIKNKLQLVEIKGSQAESWLKSRLQFQFEKMLFNPTKNYIAILNLTPTGKILGLQTRKLDKIAPWESKYLTYKLSKLYQGFRPKEIVPDEINSVSEIFGLFQVNFNLPINLFEGPFDSFLMLNSISSAGAHKSLPIEIKVRYFFDLDETGTKKAIQYIKNNEYVFLWEKLRNDIEFPHRRKFDLNDLLIWSKENNIKIPRLDGYFSNDPLDLIYI